MKKTIFLLIILISFNLQAASLSEIKSKADKGDAVSSMKMGLIYEKGIANTRKDEKQAVFYYNKAAEKGIKQAYARLGDIEYNNGNLRKALEYWRIGSQKGDNLSKAYLGRHDFNLGKFHQAKNQLQPAALKGIPIAQYYLAKIYQDGRIGAPNIVYAHVWMSLSAENYDKAKLEVRGIERKMNLSEKKASDNIKNSIIEKYFKNK